ncbi:MAG: PqqD family protein [Acutalibacteraceae bacterium]
MKIKNGFFLNEMGSEFVVVAINDDSKKIFSGMLRLNSTGAFLWNKLQSDISENDLAKALENEYSLDSSVAVADCSDFLKTLRGVGLIEE